MSVELRLQGIGKNFAPGRRVLDDITFTAEPGEYLALMGPSGCGKTTLLRIIAGLETPGEGDIHIGGARANQTPSHRRGVAMMFQRPALVPRRSVRQNLRWAWTLSEPWRHLFGDRAHAARLLDIARMLGLENDLDRPVHQLSGGQQQRVALGRCLLRQAKICLLDEPLGHLDAPLRTELRRQMRSVLRQANLTAIHVTHDPEEACAVGDRVAVMQDGRIVQIDSPAALLRKPGNRFVAEIINQPLGGLNVIAGSISREGMDTFFECAFGRWPISVLQVTALHAALFAATHGGRFPVSLGIAARAVRASSERCLDPERIALALRVVDLEITPAGAWIIASADDNRGQWVGQSDGERFSSGQNVTLSFSMQDAYWFDHATGRTLCP